MNLFNLSPIIFGIFRWYTMRLQLVGYDGMMKISVHKYLHTSRVISLSKLQGIELLSQTICMFLRVLRYSDTLFFRKFVAIDNFHLNIATSVRPSITVHNYAFCLGVCSSVYSFINNANYLPGTVLGRYWSQW